MNSKVFKKMVPSAPMLRPKVEEDKIDVKVEDQSHELNISYIDKVHREMFSKFIY
jgi:hypothetical protein